MQFDSFSAFFDMGGYGFYVWWSFGICFGLIALLLIESKSRHQKTINNIRSKVLREQKLKEVAKRQQQSEL